ncbi:MAG: amidohydrolase 2, partial [Frankiales bacterium]|nr:amidohydrolase 2 [Frankiales bacterium]
MTVDFRVRLPVELRPATPMDPSFAAGYSRVLHLDETYSRTSAELLADAAAAGVDVLVVHAEYEYGDIAPALNDAVAQFVQQPAMVGFGTVPLDGRRARDLYREVDRCHSLGLRGLNLQPAFFDRSIDDRELYPVYARAEELGLIVALHTGVHYSRARYLDHEQPLRLDRVAVDFPDLRLVACHAAWPWTGELCAVARRHPTVFLDVGAVRPRYVGEQDTGWAPLRRFMDTVLREQVLFATDWPVASPATALE